MNILVILLEKINYIYLKQKNTARWIMPDWCYLSQRKLRIRSSIVNFVNGRLHIPYLLLTLGFLSEKLVHLEYFFYADWWGNPSWSTECADLVKVPLTPPPPSSPTRVKTPANNKKEVCVIEWEKWVVAKQFGWSYQHLYYYHKQTMRRWYLSIVCLLTITQNQNWTDLDEV